MDNLIVVKDMKWECLFPAFKRGNKRRLMACVDRFSTVSPLTHPEDIFFVQNGAT